MFFKCNQNGDSLHDLIHVESTSEKWLGMNDIK